MSSCRVGRDAHSRRFSVLRVPYPGIRLSYATAWTKSPPSHRGCPPVRSCTTYGMRGARHTTEDARHSTGNAGRGEWGLPLLAAEGKSPRLRHTPCRRSGWCTERPAVLPPTGSRPSASCQGAPPAASRSAPRHRHRALPPAPGGFASLKWLRDSTRVPPTSLPPPPPLPPTVGDARAGAQTCSPSRIRCSNSPYE